MKVWKVIFFIAFFSIGSSSYAEPGKEDVCFGVIDGAFEEIMSECTRYVNTPGRHQINQSLAIARMAFVTINHAKSRDQIHKGIGLANSALRLFPYNDSAQATLGLAYNALGDPNTAEAAFDNAIELGWIKQHALNRGWVTRPPKDENPAPPLDTFEKVQSFIERIASDKASMKSQYSHGTRLILSLVQGAHLKHSRGEVDEARRLIEQALYLDDDDQHALLAIASMEFVEGNYDKARPFIERVLDINPRDREALAHASTNELFAGDFKESLRYKNMEIQVNPNRGELYQTRAALYALLDDCERAHVDVRTLFSLLPGDAVLEVKKDLAKKGVFDGPENNILDEAFSSAVIIQTISTFTDQRSNCLP